MEYYQEMSTRITPVTFWILTAIADERRHGYDIIREAFDVSNGTIELKITTLYAAIERLERQGLICSDGDEIVNGRARRYFRVSEKGADALTAEVAELESMASAARARLARPPAALARPLAPSTAGVAL